MQKTEFFIRKSWTLVMFERFGRAVEAAKVALRYWMNPNDARAWLPNFGGGLSTAGEVVNAETAMQHAAVFACVQKAASTIGQLPLQIYEVKKTGNQSQRDLAVKHPLYRVLHNQFRPGMTSFTARAMMQTDLELEGNSIAEIEFSRGGEILAIWPWPRNLVRIEPDGFNLRYFFREKTGEKEVPAFKVLHLKGIVRDGILGMSRIAAARETIGSGLGAQNYAARFFKNNAVPPGVLEFPPGTDPKDREATMEAWRAGTSGEKQHSVAALPAGCKFEKIGISMEDSQFLETNKFSYRQICAIFDMIPHMVGDLQDSSYNNMEQQGLEFVLLNLLSRVVNLEQQYTMQLLTVEEQERYTIEFNVDGLLRGDSAARWNSHKTSWEIGAKSINEIRELENLNPVEGGNTRFTMSNMVPLGPDGLPVQQQPQQSKDQAQQQPGDQAQNKNQEPVDAGKTQNN